ncbi:MAG: phosphatidate cytidylyltransferase [Bdellovibrionota bacterium]
MNKRILTGVFGGAILLSAIIFGGWPGAMLLTTVISLAMVWEYCGMIFLLPDKVEKRYALLCIAWFVAIATFLSPNSEFEIFILNFLSLFIYFLFTAARHLDEQYQQHFRELVYSVFGVAYLVFLPNYLPRLHEVAHGIHWTIVFFLINWSSDTGAYFIGKKYGKRKLFEEISPKKTVAGAVGGLVCALVVTLIYKVVLFKGMSWFGAFLIPIAVATASQIGDLCESFIKRAFDRKDSGTLLPGHGGFLDRFDGVIFSLPVMYSCVRFLS